MTFREEGRKRLDETREALKDVLPHSQTDPLTWWLWHILFALSYTHRGKLGTPTYDRYFWMERWYVSAAFDVSVVLYERRLAALDALDKELAEKQADLHRLRAELRPDIEQSERD